MGYRYLYNGGIGSEIFRDEADWNNQGICDFSEYAILAKEYKKI